MDAFDSQIHEVAATKSATSRSDTEAANLFFQLVATRYQKSSIILTSNLTFSR